MAETHEWGSRRGSRPSSAGVTPEAGCYDPSLEFEEEDDDEECSSYQPFQDLNILSGSKLLFCSEKLSIPTCRMDTYRFSLANLEDSQDVELDAILGELCALESQFGQEAYKGHARSVSSVLQGAIAGESPSLSIPAIPSGQVCSPQEANITFGPRRFLSHRRSSSGGSKPKFEATTALDLDDHMQSHKLEFGIRTKSPDNDSAFSDSVSMLSSESSASSSCPTDTEISSHGSSKTNSIVMLPSPTQVLNNISKRLQALQIEVEKENSSPAEQAARIKAGKIRIALNKIKEASIKKIFIKAYTADDSAKSLLVEERMTVGQVCRSLTEKNHVRMDPRWTLVEYVPELLMERIYEDHEFVVENLLLWVQDSPNKLQFLEVDDKYDLFINPEQYILSMYAEREELDDDAKGILLEEFFSSSAIPEVEGFLYLKSDGKKVWKKHFFVLRASGVYYCPKGRSKLSKDLVCLTTFEMNNVYIGFGWKKKYKAPTEFGFAIKHPQIQTKSSKYIKYLCTEDERTLKQWVMGIRIVKFGPTLKSNYDNLMRDIVEEDLETLAHARSVSVSSMAKTMAVSSDSSGSSGSPDRQDISLEDVVFSGPQPSLTAESMEPDVLSNRSSDTTPTPTPMEWNSAQCLMIRHDSMKSSTSSSSGCLSEKSGTNTPTAEEMAFERDPLPPSNTFDRKPKLPLTSTTRSLTKHFEEPNTSNEHEKKVVAHGNNSVISNNSLKRNLTRFFSLRRSKTEDQLIKKLNKNVRRTSDAQVTNYSTKQIVDDLSSSADEFLLPSPPLTACSSLESIDIALLPPPPPEAFRGSTTSLDSLPPPPPPLSLAESYNWSSTSSLESLPPPPPQRESVRGKNTFYSNLDSPIKTRKIEQSPIIYNLKCNKRRMSEADVKHPSPPPYLTELKLGVKSLSREFSKPVSRGKIGSDLFEAKYTISPEISNNSAISYKAYSGPKVNSRASAPTTPQSINVLTPNTASSAAQPPPPPPPPPPPLRSISKHPMTLPLKKSKMQQQLLADAGSDKKTFVTPSLMKKMHSPDTLPGQSTTASLPCPPQSFLRDLQRVMMKKWKVAQQLSTDSASTPTEILGFRETCYLAPQSQTLRPSSKLPPPIAPHKSLTLCPKSSRPPKHQKPSVEDDAAMRKKLPPPPPKRSEFTHLSKH